MSDPEPYREGRLSKPPEGGNYPCKKRFYRSAEVAERDDPIARFEYERNLRFFQAPGLAGFEAGIRKPGRRDRRMLRDFHDFSKRVQTLLSYFDAEGNPRSPA